MLCACIVQPQEASVTGDLQPSANLLMSNIRVIDRQVYAGNQFGGSVLRNLEIDALPLHLVVEVIHPALVRQHLVVQS